MKREYDFSKAKRGAVVSDPKGKTRIVTDHDFPPLRKQAFSN